MKKIFFLFITIVTVVLAGLCIFADNDYLVVVNKSTNCVTVYGEDGRPIKAMICSVGENPEDTPTGIFKISDRYRWRYLFGDVYGQYATRICGHILFHSVYYKEQREDTLQTEEYNKLGTPASMGCIRLTAEDAKWIYDNCKSGTKVVILSGGKDPLPRPEIEKIDPNCEYAGWDPTDPSEDNPWRKNKKF